MAHEVQDILFGLSAAEITKRMPTYDVFSLSKRDVCTDAIPGTVTQTCTPGNTLCCVPNSTSIAYPQCDTIFNEGFCCVSSGDCYIDTISNCTVSGAVQCTLLVAGTTEACCPPFTFCPTNFGQSTSLVRCNLVAAAVSSSTSTLKSSTSSTSTSQSTKDSLSSSSTSLSSSSRSLASTSASRSVASGASNLSTPLPTSTPTVVPTVTHASLPAGAAAGLGVCACFIVLGLAGLGFWLYKRGKRTGVGAPTVYSEAPMVYPSFSEQALPVEMSANGYNKGYNNAGPGIRTELP